MDSSVATAGVIPLAVAALNGLSQRERRFLADRMAFFVTVSPLEIQREKEKARSLRKTQWWQRQLAKGVCHYCRQGMPPKDLTMDHIVPLIRGGKSTRSNVAPACKQCNSQKKYLLPMEWEDYLSRLANERVSD